MASNALTVSQRVYRGHVVRRHVVQGSREIFRDICEELGDFCPSYRSRTLCYPSFPSEEIEDPSKHTSSSPASPSSASPLSAASPSPELVDPEQLTREELRREIVEIYGALLARSKSEASGSPSAP